MPTPIRTALAVAALVLATQTAAQAPEETVTLPANTLVEVTPAEEITSIDMEEGTTRPFRVVNDVAYRGVVVIPRGTPLDATVTWRTGKGVFGKSAKFEVTFDHITLGGRDWRLRGKHRQEGRGNTVVAVLVFAGVTGRSAVMEPGQIVNIFTDEAITVPPQA